MHRCFIRGDKDDAKALAELADKTGDLKRC